MYPSHYGRMAARSYSALCTPKEIPKEICSIVRFFKTNYRFIRKNIVANFSFLIQQLYEKYKNSFRYFINKNEMNVVNFAINDLLKHLEECDTQLFDFVLFNVKPRSVVLDEFLDNHSGKDFRRRFWLHNNIPRLLVNSNCKEISIILNRLLSENLLNWVQIKILTILVSKFENNDINNDTSNEILEILFEKSVLIDDTDNYLLNCYFKTILVFYRRNHCVDIKNKSIKFNVTGNIYKLMIFVLYFSLQSDQLSTVDKQSFYNIVEKNYMNFTNFNEEMKNDVISTLAYLQKEAPKQFKLNIFKLIFYSSLFASTYLEAYRCIILITGKCYSDILNALKDFLSIQNLTKHLKDKVLVARFFSDIAEYIPEHYQQVEPDGYYSEESDILVPKLFLEKLMNSEIQDM